MFALLFISFEESDAIKQNMNCRPNLFCQYQYRILKNVYTVIHTR